MHIINPRAATKNTTKRYNLKYNKTEYLKKLDHITLNQAGKTKEQQQKDWKNIKQVETGRSKSNDVNNC